MKRLVERMKRKRESLKMQLNELAALVGVSASALSQVEKGKSFPSIITLKAIAVNLNTSVGELIGEHEALANNPLVRFDEISFVEDNENGCASYLLSNYSANKYMDTLLLRFKPGADSKDIVKAHPGQTFLFVLEGEVEIEVDENVYRLKSRDSFYLNASGEHLLNNKATVDASVILVTTPPA